MRVRIVVFVGLAVLALGAGAALAASSAFDRANELAYLDGFQPGDDGGSGWGGFWQLTGTGDLGGTDLATSTNNGDGDSNGDGDIDTAGVAWEIYASNGDTLWMSRRFDGSLVVGQTFSINLDAVPHPDPYAAGLELVGNGTSCMDFRWNGNDAKFEVIDAGGFFISRST